MRKSNIIPFNGAYYTKDGNLHNLDGAEGPQANAMDGSMPFTGVFIGSDGAEHDITEVLAFLGSGGGDGHIIADVDRKEYPYRPNLQFETPYVIDDEVNDQTIVNISANAQEISKPDTPVILYPRVDEPEPWISTAILLSRYRNYWSVPFKTAVYQISIDPDFSNLIFDKAVRARLAVVNYENSNPILPSNATYYIRAKYIDLRDKESDWSETRVVTTLDQASIDYYLRPIILYPTDGAQIDEDEFYIRLKRPTMFKHSGGRFVEAYNVRLSTTPTFEPENIVHDSDNPVLNTKYDLRVPIDRSTTPDQVYVDVAYEFPSNERSRRSLPHLVWLKRYFRDQCIGIEITVRDPNYEAKKDWSSITRIDRNGQHLELIPQWFDEISEVYGRVVPDTVVTNPGQPNEFTQEITRLPLTYFKMESESFEPTTDNDYSMHKVRLWVSPTELDASFKPAPPFLRAPNGLAVASNILAFSDTDKVPKSQKGLPGAYGRLWDFTDAKLMGNLDLPGLNDSRIEFLHGSTFLYMRWLYALETLDMSLKNSINRLINNDDSSFNYRGIRGFAGISRQSTSSSWIEGCYYLKGYDGADTPYGNYYNGHVTFPLPDKTVARPIFLSEPHISGGSVIKQPVDIYVGEDPEFPIDMAYYWSVKTFGPDKTVGGYVPKLFTHAQASYTTSTEKLGTIRQSNIFSDSYSRGYGGDTYNTVSFGYGGGPRIATQLAFRFQLNY